MYIAIPVAVSAFAVYGPVSLLLLNCILLPVFLRSKEDLLTPFLAVFAAVLSFQVFSTAVPAVQTGTDTLSFTWSSQTKIDGGKVKGIAKTEDGSTVYISYAFLNEEEKQKFTSLELSSYQFTFSGSYVELPIPSHPYSFSMENYLRMYGTSSIFSADKLLNIEKKTTINSVLQSRRSNVKAHIHQYFPAALATEAEALLIGDRSGMDDDLASVYRTLGITHLFAISGLHVGLLVFFIREMLMRVSIRKETIDMLLLVVLPVYAVIAGGAPSVWRAVSVTMLVLLAASGKLKIRLDDSVAISAIIFICLQPSVVFQPGFQLSYTAAFSLIYSGRILAGFNHPIVISLLVTFITQIMLYPVLLYHFFELSLSSFAVNVFYVPLYSIIILPVNIILLTLTYTLPSLAAFLFLFYEPVRIWIGSATDWLAALPYQVWTPGKPGAVAIALAVFGAILFFMSVEKNKNWKPAVLCLLIPAFIIHFTQFTDRSLRVTFLDVGQGDSIVIELPYRKGVYVMDTGGRVTFGNEDWRTPETPFEIGRKIVVPYLKGRGITRIDKLIISHADADHMESADEVLEEVNVSEIHISPGSKEENAMQLINEEADRKNIPFFEMRAGISWNADDIRFYYAAPEDSVYEGNDSSLVLVIQEKNWSFLLTGDMEEASEKRFLKRYRNADFGNVILKAGHHGSKTSSTELFVKALQPEFAIISAGRNNRYGHPHPEVLERFKRHQVPVLSTAESGSIICIVTRDLLTIETAHKKIDIP